MKLPVTIFAIVSLTLFMWCEKTSFLTAFISSQNGLISLSAIPPSKDEKGSEIKDITADAELESKLISVVNMEAEEKFPRQANQTPPPSKDEKGSEIKDIKAVVESPASAVNISSVVNMEAEEELPKQDNQTCNYAQGKWVKDDTRPLYSGSDCKQWLSGMWACQLTQRTDFAYEKFRWQPHNCEMEEFEGVKFLERMRNKTIAFIGDSLGRQQFQSLMCMITSGQTRDDVVNVGSKYGLIKARGKVRPDGWAYRFPTTNTTILFYWSACLCDLEPINRTDKSTHYAMHLDRPPKFLKKFLNNFDVLVLNTGHHWNRGKFNANRWVMYIQGVPNTDRKIENISRAKNFTVHSIIRWVDSQLPHHPTLKAFYRSMSPRHFFHGDWNTGGTCDNTNPMSKGKEVLKDNSTDSVAATAVEGTKVKLLDITAPSELRDEAHMSRYSIKGTPGVQDCLHWCLPGFLICGMKSFLHSYKQRYKYLYTHEHSRLQHLWGYIKLLTACTG